MLTVASRAIKMGVSVVWQPANVHYIWPFWRINFCLSPVRMQQRLPLPLSPYFAEVDVYSNFTVLRE